MIFKTSDNCLSNHIALNGVIDLICEHNCECDSTKSTLEEESNSTNKCRYCYTNKNVDNLSIDDKIQFVSDCGYSIVTLQDIKEDEEFDLEEENAIGERYFYHLCDECHSKNNLTVVDDKYILCPTCREKYNK